MITNLLLGILFWISCFNELEASPMVIPPNVTAKVVQYESYGGKPTFFKYLSFIVHTEPQPDVYACTLNASQYANMSEIERACMDRIRDFKNDTWYRYENENEMELMVPQPNSTSVLNFPYQVEYPRKTQELLPNEYWYTYVSKHYCVGDHYIFAIFDNDRNRTTTSDDIRTVGTPNYQNFTMHLILHEAAHYPPIPDLQLNTTTSRPGYLCNGDYVMTAFEPRETQCGDIRYEYFLSRCLYVRNQSCGSCDDNRSPNSPCCFKDCSAPKLHQTTEVSRKPVSWNQWVCTGFFKKPGDQAVVNNENVDVLNNTVEVSVRVRVRNRIIGTTTKKIVFDEPFDKGTTTTNDCNRNVNGKLAIFFTSLVVLVMAYWD